MIPNRQIGWSTKANLLWEISNQLDKTLRSICTGPPCFTTTTTTTTAPLVLINSTYYPGGCVFCEAACTVVEIGLYLEQACIDTISVGCHIYSDLEGTTNAPEGYYISWSGPSSFFYIDANGLILNIDVCPQP
tara:strand:+ start:6959 stop:7357 length:399 start_codon:yes stop_codon:yes gene_type:complete